MKLLNICYKKMDNRIFQEIVHFFKNAMNAAAPIETPPRRFKPQKNADPFLPRAVPLKKP
jgi:hypothetical protein